MREIGGSRVTSAGSPLRLLPVKAIVTFPPVASSRCWASSAAGWPLYHDHFCVAGKLLEMFYFLICGRWVKRYGGLSDLVGGHRAKAYFSWIESVLMTATISIIILLVEIMGRLISQMSLGKLSRKTSLKNYSQVEVKHTRLE
jgi:hypothetical protein